MRRFVAMVQPRQATGKRGDAMIWIGIAIGLAIGLIGGVYVGMGAVAAALEDDAAWKDEEATR